MKISKSVLPLIVVGVVIYNIFFDSDGETEGQPAVTQSLQTYGEKATANDWPAIEEGFVEVSDNLSAANYYLIIDGSGSMANTGCSNGREKIAVAKESLKAFVDKLPGGANVGVFAFDQQGIGERLPLAKQNKQQIRVALDSVSAGGGTPLSLAIEAGNAALTRQAKKQLGYGEYHLVVVTDGEANSKYEPDRAVRELLEDSPIVLHTVGFCIDNRHSLNQPGYTLYKAANDPESLAAGLESVLAEAPDFSVSDFAGEG